MKSIILTVAAAALLVIPSLQAQDNKPADKPAGERGPGGPGGPGGARFSPEERIKRMTEQLSLTPEQADKIKAIYAKHSEALKPLLAKGRENLSDEDKTKIQEAMKAQRDEVAEVLTPEQKKKLEEGRRGGPGGEGRRRGGPGGPGGEKPPGDAKPGEKPADK